MKKVILRIVVVAIAIALIVLILMNTVFKTPSTLKAYNTLNDALATNGQITQMSKNLEARVNDLGNDGQEGELKNEMEDMIFIFNEEVISLQEYYSKLYYLKNVDDNSMNSVSGEVDALISNLTTANNKLNDVNSLRQNNANLDVAEYILDIKGYIIKSLNSISNLNTVICDFLIGDYYGGVYGEHLFLGKIKTEVAKEYYLNLDRVANKPEGDDFDYKSNLPKVYEMYVNLTNNEFYADTVEELNNLYGIMDKAKDLNIGRIVTDFKNYVDENKLGEEDKENVEKVNKLRNIGFIMQFINSIGDQAVDPDKKFVIRDSSGFVMPDEVKVENK